MARMDASTRTECAVVLLAAALALVSALPYAGSANDGSRLATAESLVDRGTFVIDQSIFVAVPPDSTLPRPYSPGNPALEPGTLDKAFIGGHFYSDKAPVLPMFMACLYYVLHALTGISASQHADFFCKAMAFGTGGLSYIAAVWCIWRLFGRTPLSLHQRLTMTALFALGTLALPYMRNVNNHIVLLAAAAPLFLGLDVLAATAPRWRPGLILLLGSFAGLCYTLDPAAGPPLMAAGAIVVYRTRSFAAAALFGLAALPWLALHHAVTYAIGGTIGPHAAVPEYFRWPGSPFDESNLTGVWGNHGLSGLLMYTGEMLFGRKRGFFLNNLPLLLVFPALLALWQRRREIKEWPELTLALGWAFLTIAVYATGSTGLGGWCTSIRWFVPLLAAGFYVVAVALRYEPSLLGDLNVLAFWSLVTGALLWRQAAWFDRNVSILWLIQLVGITHWVGLRAWRWRGAAAARDESFLAKKAA